VVWSRGLSLAQGQWKYFYKTVRGALPNCTASFFLLPRILWLLPIFLTTRLHGGNHPVDGSIFPSRKTIIFNNVIHLLLSGIHCELGYSCSILHKSRYSFWLYFPTTRLYWSTLPDCTAAASNLVGFCPFFDYQTTRVQPPWWSCFFPFRNPILFNNIIMHLLYTSIQYDLDRSCSILHKSRDAFDHFSDYQTVQGHITTRHGVFFEFEGLCPFLATRLHVGQPLWWWLLFSLPKTILFNIMVMQLLHSCTNCDMDHSCSILHKSRDIHLA